MYDVVQDTNFRTHALAREILHAFVSFVLIRYPPSQHKSMPLCNTRSLCIEREPIIGCSKLHLFCHKVYSKTCVKRPLKIDKTKIFMTNGRLMKVNSTADCFP